MQRQLLHGSVEVTRLDPHGVLGIHAVHVRATLGAGPAGQTISLMPIFGALLARQLLGEKLQTFHRIGMSLILGGITLTWLLRDELLVFRPLIS